MKNKKLPLNEKKPKGLVLGNVLVLRCLSVLSLIVGVFCVRDYSFFYLIAGILSSAFLYALSHIVNLLDKINEQLQHLSLNNMYIQKGKDNSNETTDNE